MKIKTLIKVGLWSMAALVLAACTSEDTIEKNAQKQTEPRVVASFSGQFAAPTRQAKTRTTGKHVFHTDMKVAWSAGDRIWVKSIDGTWHRSEPAEFLTADHSRANFKLISGNYGFNPEVRYVGASANPNQVIIPQTQSQTTLGEFGHLGASGDCGTATAKGGGGDYEFELEHKAAYICFYPRIQNDALHHNVRLEQISIGEMYVKDLGGWFDFSNQSIKDKNPSASGTSDITLNTNSAPIPSATRNDTCFYIAIRPGTGLALTVSFTIKDPTTNATATITNETNWWFGSFEAGKIYDYTAWLDKDIKNYDGDHYYMWDAQQQYWKGYEWTKNLAAGVGQTTLAGQPAGNYAQNSTDPRYYNTSYPGPGISNPATHTSCKDLPNANELSWYCMYGDPRWDANKLWTTMGHLYQGGMWFKKKSVLQAEGNYDTEKSADRTTDLRTTWKRYDNSNSSITNFGLPSAADAGNYFFLPALGYYGSGQLNGVGVHGYYWSSSADSWDSNGAYPLYFRSGNVRVDSNYRYFGFRVDGFE